jgi:hypothetical protein
MRGVASVLMIASILLAACSEGATPRQPDLPASVAPGWTRATYQPSSPPAGLPEGSRPTCWEAGYTGPGVARVWVCGYRNSGGAFDAVQRARAEANTVKFQEGNFLVIATWNGGTRADVTALIRSIQRTLRPK